MVKDRGPLTAGDVMTTLQVGDIMQEDVATVPVTAPLPEIARRMARERIHRVFVTKGEKLLGIVTSIDLLAHFPR